MLIKEQLEKEAKLSSLQQTIAKKILELEDDLADLTIRELAELSYTSTTAIIRLCQKLGYDKYSDFKKAYLKEVHYLKNYFQEVDANLPFTKEDPLTRVCGSIASLYEQTTKDTLSLVDYSQLIHATMLLQKAKIIYVICIGVGNDIAKVFADKMLLIGKKVVVIDNFNEQFYQVHENKKDDCFIVITYTGTTTNIRKYYKYLTKGEASTILITSVSETYLSSQSDAVLKMTTREKLYSNISSFSSTLSTMLILDMLYASYFQKDYDHNLEKKIKIANDYEDARSSISEIMDENNITLK